MAESAPERSPESANESASVAPEANVLHPMFFGPSGVRAGWRLLIFLALAVAILLVLAAALSAALRFISPLQHFVGSLHPTGAITAPTLIVTEGLTLLAVILAAAIMTRIENRTFADYGLPADRVFGKQFWLGLPFGFVMLSVLLGLMAAFHGFSPGSLALTGASALKYGALWGIGFLLVGFFEDFTFRGYMQSTLASAMGFWPAALVLALVFGAIHLSNRGEGPSGAFTAGLFGVVEAFSLWRTHSIWFAIGMHTSWDWSQSYFYGVPDSGQVVPGHLLNASFHGANWLTGGTIGPEGSVLVYPTLLLMAVAIHFLFPAQRAAS